ncbi:hypothetical protein D3C80_1686150 [compost metagenome]
MKTDLQQVLDLMSKYNVNELSELSIEIEKETNKMDDYLSKVNEFEELLEAVFHTYKICKTCCGKGYIYENHIGDLDPYARSSDYRTPCPTCRKN